MSSKPLIGVPACRRIIDPHPFHIVGDKYMAALIDGADALPVAIPALGPRLAMDELLARIDGLFLTGSPSNVEPHHYEGDASAPGTLHDPERDETTLPLTRMALDAGVPVFAVCRGFQELNVVLGGSLHQDVSAVAGYHDHSENPDDPLERQYAPSHPVNLVEGGFLHELLGKLEIPVNSLHKQGVRRLAEGVSVAAIADDGLVEAFTVDSAAGFALAVQWHPEWQVTDNPDSMKLFAAFGDACRDFAKIRKV